MPRTWLVIRLGYLGRYADTRTDTDADADTNTDNDTNTDTDTDTRTDADADNDTNADADTNTQEENGSNNDNKNTTAPTESGSGAIDWNNTEYVSFTTTAEPIENDGPAQDTTSDGGDGGEAGSGTQWVGHAMVRGSAADLDDSRA